MVLGFGFGSLGSRLEGQKFGFSFKVLNSEARSGCAEQMGLHCRELKILKVLTSTKLNPLEYSEILKPATYTLYPPKPEPKR